MGNCIKPSSMKKQQEEDFEMEKYRDYGDEEQEFEKENGSFDSENNSKNGVKVKIVLTKEELEWLMFQLTVSNGGKKLADVLQEIERERVKGKVRTCWKPSLESIIESPEGLDMER
ncbi:hypothetical protein JCGZ_20452 [Jatropha curcas]|uniref:Uncharacterized protein n=1 Tax=Jatropha curcas TaxID=180498 RepID=A0A067JMU7_JATCU|nr:uncharacterized protein LOC105645670 [Jatropha curcas]KDP25296.1 hypothetical protein JCGZ_20452 [Jatropha curcas]